MTALIVEPFGGMAGDMFLAALLDLQDQRFRLSHLQELAEALLPGQVCLECESVKRGGLRALHLDVQTRGETPPTRHLANLLTLLERAPLGELSVQRCTDVLTRLAAAEAQVHGIALEQVHFHEVGAVDTLIDVAGAALALERLGVQQVYSSAPFVGGGTVNCAHGELPVPPPAVSALLTGRPVLRPKSDQEDGERTTPTGAALLRAWTADFELPSGFQNQAWGVGAGTRDPKGGRANLLRVEIGRVLSENPTLGAHRREAWCMQVNLDDLCAEEIGHALGKVREAGALEAWTSPVHMKKDRPGTLMSALARDEQREAIEAAVFQWTTSLGVRWTRLERTECERDQVRVQVGGTEVRVVRRMRPQQTIRRGILEEGPGCGAADLFPEYDDLVAAAEATGWTLREVRSLAIQAAQELVMRNPSMDSGGETDRVSPSVKVPQSDPPFG